MLTDNKFYQFTIERIKFYFFNHFLKVIRSSSFIIIVKKWSKFSTFELVEIR